MEFMLHASLHETIRVYMVLHLASILLQLLKQRLPQLIKIFPEKCAPSLMHEYMPFKSYFNLCLNIPLYSSPPENAYMKALYIHAHYTCMYISPI